MLELFAKASNPAGWHMFTAAQNSQNEICIILKEVADFILSVLLTCYTNRCNGHFQALTFLKKNFIQQALCPKIQVLTVSFH